MFPSKMPSLKHSLLALVSVICLSGCAEREPRVDRFEQTGKLLALSGGDAGADGACINCHGLQGEGNGGDAPRLAGLNSGYIVRQMDYFSTGLRRHPKMVWIADHVDRPQRLRLGQYYQSLPVPDEIPGAGPTGDAACEPRIASLYHRGDPDRGIPSCASCHAADGRGDMANPPLAGQPAPYLELQLKHWRNGERYGNPQSGMLQISRLLADEELQGLAGYSSALRDATRYPALPAACLPERRPDPRNGA